MKTFFKKESYVLLITLIPFIYLLLTYSDIPDTVILHWDANGVADASGSKSNLFFIAGLGVFIYLIFLVVPKLDPKQRLDQMGNKYQKLKSAFVIFMSCLSLILIYSSINPSFIDHRFMIFMLGILYTTIGNYSKTIQPNYFIGFRTPWTLENEVVWKQTHELVGKLWFVGGMAIAVLSFLLDYSQARNLFLAITALITIIPTVYSYLSSRKQKQSANA